MEPITIQLTQKPLDPSPAEEAEWIREWITAAYYILSTLEGETPDMTFEEVQGLFPELSPKEADMVTVVLNYEIPCFNSPLSIAEQLLGGY